MSSITIFLLYIFFFFFFNDTATTEIYTLSLHDALPISLSFTDMMGRPLSLVAPVKIIDFTGCSSKADRKSTRLNSSHVEISYAVFCLKKKKKINTTRPSDLLHRRLACVTIFIPQ